ncbi:hypothetical protein CDO52_07100 [Nocardiopsis gilva YIM 90087]|uniref:Sensor domain-containing protein n=1 Tax=Nocardiopsis gilva YIM 90087 TaxID=1235441 RepID=A0A223S371_9ACTN|nr:hypothetical protein [Nocardiopsis gilva]ASU82582.1 hypothetical protein CDO52_07100 [Nocardiopsis gilva YIM 90087]
MTPFVRQVGVSALLAPLVLAATACSGPTIEPKSSKQLDAMLPPETAYPDGYVVESLDVEEPRDTSSGEDFDRVEPAKCATAMESMEPDQLPQGATHGAMQTAVPTTSSEADTFYTFALAEGDFSDGDLDTAAVDRLITACWSFTAYVDDVEFEGSVRRLRSTERRLHPDADAKDKEGLIMSLSTGGTETTTRASWGEASGTYYALVGVTAKDESGASALEAASACSDSLGEAEQGLDSSRLTTCTRNYKRKIADAEAEERYEEFDKILSAGLEQLR